MFSGANLERVFTEGTDTKLKPKQRLALRPEGTAGVERAVGENNLVPQGSTPFKAYYAEAMFRGERPQKGRLRQFHQVGIEVVADVAFKTFLKFSVDRSASQKHDVGIEEAVERR